MHDENLALRNFANEKAMDENANLKKGFEKCRLMSFKSNPWLKYGQDLLEDGD